VRPATTQQIVDFTRQYHYAGAASPYACSWRWGLWYDDTLLGVVSYNVPTISTCDSLFGPEGRHKVWHMNRMAFLPDAPKNSESRLIGLAHREIERNFDVWGIVTYADAEVGHVGYIYQATNAFYTGKSVAKPYFRDPDGNRRSLYRDGKTLSREIVERLGYVRHQGVPKYRYVYILGTRSQRRERFAMLRYSVLDYPKG
jgi:hypothetical protein